MSRILVIDDDPTYHQMITHALVQYGHQVSIAQNGEEGLQAVKEQQPDLIICDVLMPGISGYEVTQQIRKDPQFANLPILVLTSRSGLQDKLQSFEAGADDHLTKPFEPAELLARIEALLRRARVSVESRRVEKGQEEGARLIAVHSLKGGLGCSTLAINVAIALHHLWDCPTLLLDLDPVAGQISLMLDSPLKRTWADLNQYAPEQVNLDILRTIINHHESGLRFIASPSLGPESTRLNQGVIQASLAVLKNHYDYLVADLPHDFSELTMNVLDIADVILLVLAPDLVSVRAAVVAINTYLKRNYTPDKFKLVVNVLFPRYGLARDQIESALSYPITMVIPYSPEKFVEAINISQPVVHFQPLDPITTLIDYFAFQLSKEQHKMRPPETPTLAWNRINRIYQNRNANVKPGNGAGREAVLEQSA